MAKSRSTPKTKQKIGLALGSGSARGWAHIGVIQELADMGIKPDVISGTSIGALVGAAYVSNHLDELADWVIRLNTKEIVGFLDLKLLTGGGFVEGIRLFDYLRSEMGDQDIENLAKPFGAVSCNLASGQEIWFRDGSLLDAVRASIALPGLFTPVKWKNTWLIDGGLVNPVPVSLCRALGADMVIAVNLNGDIVGKHFRKEEAWSQPASTSETELSLLDKLAAEFKQRTSNAISEWLEPDNEAPGLFDVIATSVNIMQDRITRSRMAGDPPDVLIAPRLAHIGLMEFDRADEAIAQGRKAVRRARPALEDFLGNQ